MDRDEIGKILAESVGRRRGYADLFDWPDKSIKEWGVVKEFCKELELDGGPRTVSQKQHPGGQNHAPDYQIITETGENWGLELTELVSQKALEATRGRSGGAPLAGGESQLGAGSSGVGAGAVSCIPNVLVRFFAFGGTLFGLGNRLSNSARLGLLRCCPSAGIAAFPF